MASKEKEKKEAPEVFDLNQWLGAAWVQPVQVPDRLQVFFDEYFQFFAWPQTTVDCLKGFTRQDVKADEVAAILKRNQYYEELIQKHIGSLSKRDQEPPVESTVVLLGMQNSRDFILGCQLKRQVSGLHPEWDEKSGKLTWQFKNFVKFALKSEEPFLKDKDGFQETAYAAGLVFDTIFHIAEKKGADKKQMEWLEHQFKLAQRSAILGRHIADCVSDFVLKKYAYAVGILLAAGQTMMMLLDSKYMTFLEEAKKKDVTNEMILELEEKIYGFHHGYLASLIARGTRIFSPVEGALRSRVFPGVWKSKNRGLYQLSSVLLLAHNMGRHFKKTNDPNDAAVGKWRAPGVEDFSVTAQHLVGITGKVNF